MTPAATRIAIRDARASDIPAITDIYGYHVRRGTGSFEVAPPDEAEMSARIAAIVDGGYPWLVATHDDGVIAYAYAAPYRSRHGYRFTVEDSVYVAQQARGKGTGAALLSRLIDICGARGDRQMVAVIGDSANAASVALHARAGFVHAGTLANVGRKFERWLDVILMQRALGEGHTAPPVERE